MLDFQAARWLIARRSPKQAGNDHPTSIPTGVFKTTDGHINIATTGGAIWERFCKRARRRGDAEEPGLRDRQVALGEPQGAQRRDRHLHRSTSRSAEWIDIFNKAGVPCGPIYNIDQVFADPQVKHLGIAQSVKKKDKSTLNVVGQPFTLSRTKSKIAAPPPELGRAHRRGAEGIRLQREGDRRAAPSQGGLTPRRARHVRRPAMNQAQPMPRRQTDKMLSRKEGSVGYVIFNNPERHNAVSLDMWAGGGRDARRLPQRQRTSRSWW